MPPPAPGPIRLQPDEVAALLRPYVSVRFLDQVKAVVPLGLAMGLGFGNATQAVEGFGILCMASIGPIISVLLTGLWAGMRAKLRERAARHAPAIHHEQEIQTQVRRTRRSPI
ncbi:DUF1538 family protein [Thiocapsa bogorovii]|uniref:DUF1538 family protein n=1 Tax=Thiocapsa bogorovii TaxID=521689 RepID=UPI001E3A2357|nr:DUF1538 family protein [Thiocapsa bogorovii]UHD14484.1 DUF1538 domain-containing protein [Thiocapsa bogorovii]